MVEPLPLSSARTQYSRPGIVLRAANSNSNEKYAEKEKSGHEQSHRFVDYDDSYNLNLVV